MSFLGGLWKVVQGKPVYDGTNQINPTNQQPQNPAPSNPMAPTEEIQGPMESSLESPNIEPIHDSPVPLGQPVQTDQPGQAAEQAAPEGEATIQVDNAHTFPTAYIKRTITKIEGPTMYVYCYIANESNMPLDIHRIELLGHEQEIRHPMEPGAIKEFLVYNGPLLLSQNDHQATLVYKTEHGEYFEAIHEIRFTYNNNTHTYSVDEFRLRQPIKRMALF
jgi:hypothetical protein